MSHARIEEVSDSDPEIDDPTTYLPDSDNSIIAPANLPPATATSRTPRAPNTNPPPSQQGYTQLRPQAPSSAKQQREQIKAFCTIYPVYFDSSRTRANGRRVSSKLATPNPLAYSILQALPSILAPHQYSIPTAFEPDKTHPKDWSNPGRVRLQLFDKETHAPMHPTIQSKSHLFILIAKHLQSHPTSKEDPLKLQIQGLNVPDGGLKEPAVPRGWKVNAVLPMHSAAMSGGGVSDNFFKEAMEELRQAQLEQGGGSGAGTPQLPMGAMNGLAGMMGGGDSAGSGGGVVKKKKDKKKG